MNDRNRTLIFIAFLVLTILTALAALGANLGFFGEPVRNSNFASWSMAAVLGEIVAATVVLFRVAVVPRGPIDLTLSFKDKDGFEVDLNEDQCTYLLVTEAGPRPEKRLFVYTDKQHGWWQCRLPPDATEHDLVEFRLIERNGARWRVPRFRPVLQDRMAIPDGSAAVPAGNP
jgi:hypothetical protein